MDSIYHMCWILVAQITPGAAEAGDAVADAAEAAPEGGLFGGLGYFLPMMLAVMMLYVLFMGRPQSKEQGRNSSPERLAGLKKNDQVVTAGGIIGTVVNIRDDLDHITIRVDESTGARMQVLKQSISRVMNDEDAKDEA